MSKRKTIQRLCATLCSLVAVLLFLAATPASAEREIALEVWHNWFDRTGQEVWQTLKEGFEKTHPGIEVHLLVVPWNNPQKLLTAIIGNVPPDVTMIDRPTMSQWASRGALVPLDALMERDHFDGSRFFESTWEETSYQGHHWVIPFNTDARALYYNRKMFEEAGLDPNRPPRTWEELKEYSDRLTVLDEGGKIKRLGFAPLISVAGFGTADLETYAWQLGAKDISADGARVTIGTIPWVTALERVVRFVDEYPGGGLEALLAFQGEAGVYGQDPFITGKIAMWEHGTWYLRTLRTYGPHVDFGVAEIPIPQGGQPAFLAAGYSLGIPRGSKHIEEGWEFIKYCTSKEAQSVALPMADQIPANLAAAHSPYYTEDPVWRFFIDRMPYARHRAVTPVNSLRYNEVRRAAELAIHKGKTPQQALDDAAREVQEELDRYSRVSQYPSVEWTRIYQIILPLVLVALVLFLIYLKARLRSRMVAGEAIAGYFMAAPWLIGFTVFVAWPILCSLVYSFCDYQVLTPARYLGLDNYRRLLFEDEMFPKSLYNTVYYTIFAVPLGVLGSMLLALLLNSKIHGIRFFRTVYYTPAVVSGVAVAVLWMWLLNPESGLINQLLANLGIPGPLWLADKHWAKPAFILMSLWGIGGGMIIFLAGLQGIPGQLYEAARIDGAGRLQSFLHVTLPMLTPTIFFNLIVGFIVAFQIFTQAYVMTDGQGGPADSTMFYALYLFRQAFVYFNMGYASALAWILFLIILAVTLVQLASAKRWVYYEGQD